MNFSARITALSLLLALSLSAYVPAEDAPAEDASALDVPALDAPALDVPALDVPAEDATYPGEISTPYPTLTCLAVEWIIQGDDNLNGIVETSYRAFGDKPWNTAMPPGANS